MRARPPDLSDDDIVAAVAAGWGVRAEDAAYVPEGGGSHHWRLADEHGGLVFMTIDDLDDKSWMADTRDDVFDGLRAALEVAAALRDEVGLDFVVGPVADGGGDVVRRLGSRYALSVYPFITGESFAFGAHVDAARRDQVLDMIVAIHGASTEVASEARVDGLGFSGRGALEAALAAPDHPWSGGPFSSAAQSLVAERAPELTELMRMFDSLAAAHRPSPSELVITHGEPHAGNVMSVDGRLVLIDWDTLALGPPERDLWLVVSDEGDEVARYEAATGRRVDPARVFLYRLRWYLDDVASAVRMFSRPHQRSADTERWLAGLAPRLDQLPRWTDELARYRGARS